jgi:malonyl-CoA decarboxylase
MNATTTWISRRVSKLLPAARPRRARPSPRTRPGGPRAARRRPARAQPAPRSTRERLEATLRQGDEALSPRMLRLALDELRAIVDPRVSEVEGGRRAMALAAWYEAPRRRAGAICGC